MSFSYRDPTQEKRVRQQEWMAANPGRDVLLCDMLDACPDVRAKRATFASFSQADKAGMMDEWCRRFNNRAVPVGTIVGPRAPPGYFSITQRSAHTTTYAVHSGTATVIGQVDGELTRYLMLHVPWEDKEGRRMVFVTAYAHELVDLTEGEEVTPSIKGHVV